MDMAMAGRRTGEAEGGEDGVGSWILAVGRRGYGEDLVAWLVVLRVTVQPGPLPLTAKPDSVRDRLPSDRDYKSETSAVGWESDGS